MKPFLPLVLAIIFAPFATFAQIPIVTQGFEIGDTWQYTSNPEFYNFNNGDVFDVMFRRISKYGSTIWE